MNLTEQGLLLELCDFYLRLVAYEPSGSGAKIVDVLDVLSNQRQSMADEIKSKFGPRLESGKPIPVFVYGDDLRLSLTGPANVELLSEEGLATLAMGAFEMAEGDYKSGLFDATSGSAATEKTPNTLLSAAKAGYISKIEGDLSSIGLSKPAPIPGAFATAGAIANHIKSGKVAGKVAYLYLGMEQSQLIVVGPKGVEAIEPVNAGVHSIIIGVQQALNLKFAGSAAKLFHEGIYDFTDTATILLQALVTACQSSLGNLSAKPDFFYCSNLLSHKKWVLNYMSDNLGLKLLPSEHSNWHKSGSLTLADAELGAKLGPSALAIYSLLTDNAGEAWMPLYLNPEVAALAKAAAAVAEVKPAEPPKPAATTIPVRPPEKSKTVVFAPRPAATAPAPAPSPIPAKVEAPAPAPAPSPKVEAVPPAPSPKPEAPAPKPAEPVKPAPAPLAQQPAKPQPAPAASQPAKPQPTQAPSAKPVAPAPVKQEAPKAAPSPAPAPKAQPAPAPAKPAPQPQPKAQPQPTQPAKQAQPAKASPASAPSPAPAPAAAKAQPAPAAAPAQAAKPVQQPAAKPAPTVSTEKKEEKKSPVLIIVIAAILLLLAILGFVFMGKSKSDAPTSAATGSGGQVSGTMTAEQQRVELERIRKEEEARKLAEQKRLEEERIAAEQLAAEEARIKAEQERLARARGSVRIVSEPAGAEVRINGELKGIAPLTVGDLKIGNYTVTLSRRGYESVKQTFEITDDGQTIPMDGVRLPTLLGSLTIGTTPAGVKFDIRALDNAADTPRIEEARRVTPLEITDVMPGRYEITYKRQGWPEYKETVTIQEKGQARSNFQFVGGELRVTTKPSGATVKAGERTLGKTPLVLENMDPGALSLEITLDGWEPETTTVTMTPKEVSRVEMELLDLDRIVPASQVEVYPRRIAGIDPPHPNPAAVRQDTVVIRCLIGKDGVPTDFKVISSTDKACERAALDAIRQWRFTPAKRKGFDVKTVVDIPFQFRVLNAPAGGL